MSTPSKKGVSVFKKMGSLCGGSENNTTKKKLGYLEKIKFPYLVWWRIAHRKARNVTAATEPGFNIQRLRKEFFASKLPAINPCEDTGTFKNVLIQIPDEFFQRRDNIFRFCLAAIFGPRRRRKLKTKRFVLSCSRETPISSPDKELNSEAQIVFINLSGFEMATLFGRPSPDNLGNFSGLIQFE